MTASTQSPHEPGSLPPRSMTLWTWAAFLTSLVALAGSLYLSIGMELVACPLCFYQRTFVMAVVGVLSVGLLSRAHRLSLLALPAAVGGVGVAAFHVYLEMTGKLECPKGVTLQWLSERGVTDLGTAPQQSLVALTVLLAFLVLDVLATRLPSTLAFLWSIVLGILFTWGALASAPKPADPPKKPYDGPPTICRPPYKPAA